MCITIIDNLPINICPSHSVHKKCKKGGCLILRPHWVHLHPNKKKTNKSWVSAGRTSQFWIPKFKTTSKFWRCTFIGPNDKTFILFFPTEHQQDVSYTEVKSLMGSFSFALSAIRSQLMIYSFNSPVVSLRSTLCTQSFLGKTTTKNYIKMLNIPNVKYKL